jgi:Trp operon repressor
VHKQLDHGILSITRLTFTLSSRDPTVLRLRRRQQDDDAFFCSGDDIYPQPSSCDELRKQLDHGILSITRLTFTLSSRDPTVLRLRRRQQDDDTFFCSGDGIYPQPSSCDELRKQLDHGILSITRLTFTLSSRDPTVLRLRRRQQDDDTFFCTGDNSKMTAFFCDSSNDK